jgi:CRISPR-associated protein Cas5d
MAGTTHTLEVWGDLACFTRPEMKVERFSYPIITPSAARGIFDAIYWEGIREQRGRESVMRPYFHWQVTRVEVLAMPRYIALRRNEVKDRVPAERTVKAWMAGWEVPEPIWADASKDELGTDQKGRTQRQTMALKNVHYRISARIAPNAGSAHALPKFEAMFKRRAGQGKCFHQPYLGCREFPAFFAYLEAPTADTGAPVPYDQHLGLMLYDVFDITKDTVAENEPPFISLFDARVAGGVLDVPPFECDRVIKPRRT